MHAPTLHERATDTRRRKQAAGKYANAAQKDAFARLLRVGQANLTVAELETLATHPHMTEGQRREYATLAAAR